MAKTDTPQVHGKVSAQQIEQYKSKHETVHEVTIKDPRTGEVHVCYLHNPEFHTMANMLSMTQAKQTLEAGELVLENCWIDGSEFIRKDKDSQLYQKACLFAMQTVDLDMEGSGVKKL